MEVVPPHVLAIGSLVPVQKSSPERRNQKEIVAGEERPKFLTIKQTEDAQGECARANHIYDRFFLPLEEISEFIANANFRLFFAPSSEHFACFCYLSRRPPLSCLNSS